MKFVDAKYTAALTDHQLFRIQRALESDIRVAEWREVLDIVRHARGDVMRKEQAESFVSEVSATK